MSNWVEFLERREFLSASGVRAHWDTLPPVIAGEAIPSQAIAHAIHPTSGVIEPTVRINWGDGTTQSSSAYALSATEAVANSTHTYKRPGDYLASVTFFSGSKVAAKTTKLIHVTRNSPGGVVFSARAGQRFEHVVGQFTSTAVVNDVMIQWGDGMQGPGTVTSLGNGRYEVSGGHTYARPGSYRIRVLAATDEMTTKTPPPLAYPPPPPHLGIRAPYGTISVVLDSSVHVEGKATKATASPAQLTGFSNITLYSQSSSATWLGSLSGITPDPYTDGPYALVSFDDRSTYDSYGTVEYGSGKWLVSIPSQFNYAPSLPPPGVHNVTVTVLLNDHVDPSQNTVLGVLHEAVTVVPPASGTVVSAVSVYKV